MTTINKETLQAECQQLGIPPSYEHFRRLRRSMELRIDPTLEGSFERVYNVHSQRDPSIVYKVKRTNHGLQCPCPDSQNNTRGQLCKHAMAVIRKETH